MRISFDQSAADPGARQRQQRELRRVERSLAAIVTRFCTEHVFTSFSMRDLTEYVTRAAGTAIAPDSAGRILRQLRSSGVVEYTVKNRASSLYQITRVNL